MIRRTKESHEHIINLDGPDGNAFYLIGLALNVAKQLQWTNEEIDDLQARLKAGDYYNLLKVFDKEFGMLFVLETKDEAIINLLNEEDN